MRALESLRRLEVPAGLDWDVLIIDNGSANAAKQERSLPGGLPLRVVKEPRAGLSHARNAALRLATGDLVIFIDDDVTVPPGWLAAYADGFSRHPDAAFFGGPIAARCMADCPGGCEPSWR